eukprot:4100989-Alexandrium_andersonii.AAC.1
MHVFAVALAVVPAQVGIAHSVVFTLAVVPRSSGLAHTSALPQVPTLWVCLVACSRRFTCGPQRTEHCVVSSWLNRIGSIAHGWRVARATRATRNAMPCCTCA